MFIWENLHLHFVEQELLADKQHCGEMVIICPEGCHLSSWAIPKEKDSWPIQKQWGCDSLYLSFIALPRCKICAQFKHQEEEQEAASAHFCMGGSLDPSSMESGPGFLFSKYSCLTSADFCWFK